MAFEYEQLIVDIPDYPVPGVTFKDITPVVADSAAFAATVDGIADTLGDVSKVFLKLIRFRPFGVRGDLEGHPAPSMAFMNRLKARAESRGFRRVLIL